MLVDWGWCQITDLEIARHLIAPSEAVAHEWLNFHARHHVQPRKSRKTRSHRQCDTTVYSTYRKRLRRQWVAYPTKLCRVDRLRRPCLHIELRLCGAAIVRSVIPQLSDLLTVDLEKVIDKNLFYRAVDTCSLVRAVARRQPEKSQSDHKKNARMIVVAAQAQSGEESAAQALRTRCPPGIQMRPCRIERPVTPPWAQ
ncbi:MAG: hypothetical protein AAF663_02715 [Planctomycetota bacterium]